LAQIEALAQVDDALSPIDPRFCCFTHTALLDFLTILIIKRVNFLRLSVVGIAR
jgi:hypothetical protein